MITSSSISRFKHDNNIFISQLNYLTSYSNTGAFGHFKVTHDIRKTTALPYSLRWVSAHPYCCSLLHCGLWVTSRDRRIRLLIIEFYIEEGNWDLVGNNPRSSSSVI